MKKELLRVMGLGFKYNQETILSDLFFSVFEGEILTIVGSNGVGKTVLGNVLSGRLSAQTGMILYNGKELSKKECMEKISYIPENVNLLNDMTVMENVFIGNDFSFNTFFSNKKCRREVQAYLDKYNLNIRAEQLGMELSVAKKNMVLLLRQLIARPKLLIVDSSLDFMAFSEAIQIQRLIQDIKKQGTTIIYLTYNYETAKMISDRILILKDGLILYDINANQKADSIIKQVVMATELPIGGEKREAPRESDIILEARNISFSEVENVTFKLHKGEVVGFVGLNNSNISNFFNCFTGHNQIRSGQIIINGKKVVLKNPLVAASYGIRFCGDKKEETLLGERESIRLNMVIGIVKKISRFGLIQKRYEDIIVEDICQKFDIRQDVNTKLGNLNYASMAKVAIAACMLNNPKVLILNKITRGLDDEGMLELYHLLEEVRKTCGIIINFSKFEKEISICDRIIVWDKVGVRGELKGEEASHISSFANYK